MQDERRDHHELHGVPDEEAVGPTSFSAWKAGVDAEIRKRTGMISDDLPDVDYRGLYETGDSPAEAAEYAIDYAMNN
jgi:hypothetical protein